MSGHSFVLLTPSAQLTVLSAVAFDDAVRDHFQNATGHLDEKKARQDLG
jgi:hypothetical protein